MLFLVYINDLVSNIRCEIKLFADDTTLYVAVDNAADSSASLNPDLQSISSWAKEWIVLFNPSKTKSMIITRRNTQHQPLYFDNTVLEEVESHKHLGLLINNKLSWSDHISTIINSASKMLDVLKRLKYTIDRKSLETIYFSFVRPKLEYACQIWDDCNERDSEHLENINLCAARIVTGAKRGTSHALIYRETNWESLADRRKSVKLKFFHKIVHGEAPEYLKSLLPDQVHHGMPYPLRNSTDIRQYHCRTEKLKNSVIPSSINDWNKLGSDIRAITGANEFCKKVSPGLRKSMDLYNYGKRKLNVIHAQMRMCCSNLKAHLYLLHVVDDPLCVCSQGVEDNEHFFFVCPLYVVLRNRRQCQ